MEYLKGYRTVADKEFGPLECPVCHCLFMGGSAYSYHMRKFHGIRLQVRNSSLANYAKHDEDEGTGEVSEVLE